MNTAADDLEHEVGLAGGQADDPARTNAAGEDAGDEGDALTRCRLRQLASSFRGAEKGRGDVLGQAGRTAYLRIETAPSRLDFRQ